MATDQAAPKRTQFLKRNIAYAKTPNPADWYTQLSPQEEEGFRAWLKQGHNDPRQYVNPDDRFPDYDMRGFYKAMLAGDPNAKFGYNPNTKNFHAPDQWKTPFHESFSGESVYANPKYAPKWRGNKLIAPDGTVLYEDKPEK